MVGALDRPGLMVLVGVTHTDTAATAAKLAAKIWTLRILADERSAADIERTTAGGQSVHPLRRHREGAATVVAARPRRDR